MGFVWGFQNLVPADPFQLVVDLLVPCLGVILFVIVLGLTWSFFGSFLSMRMSGRGLSYSWYGLKSGSAWRETRSVGRQLRPNYLMRRRLRILLPNMAARILRDPLPYRITREDRIASDAAEAARNRLRLVAAEEKRLEVFRSELEILQRRYERLNRRIENLERSGDCNIERVRQFECQQEMLMVEMKHLSDSHYGIRRKEPQ